MASSEEERPRRERRCWGYSVLEGAPLQGLWVAAELIKEEDAAERGASVLMGPAGWRRRGCLGFFMAEEGEGKSGREGERGVVSGGCSVPFCWRRREAVRLICKGKMRLIGC